MQLQQHLNLVLLACGLTLACSGNDTTSAAAVQTSQDAAGDAPDVNPLDDLGAPTECPESATLTVTSVASCWTRKHGQMDSCVEFLQTADADHLRYEAQNCLEGNYFGQDNSLHAGCCPPGWLLGCKSDFDGPQVQLSWVAQSPSELAGHKAKCQAIGGIWLQKP